MKHKQEHSLYGTGLFGEPLAPERKGPLAERFLIPPFSTFSAREGWWQERKRSWIALGIQSELGRGGATGVTDKAAPGHSLMPAMDYSNGERGNSAGQPIAKTATAAPGAVTIRAQMPAILPVIKTQTALPAPAAAAGPAVFIKPRAVQITPVNGNPVTRLKPLEQNPFLVYHGARLSAAGAEPLRFDGIEDNGKPTNSIGLDVESYSNFFLVCLQRFDDKARETFELSDRSPNPNWQRLAFLMANNVIVTFNGLNYDMYMIALAMTGATPEQLKELSNQIIFRNERPYKLRLPQCQRHVDLKEPCPARKDSLKMIAARLHARFLQDLPFVHDKILTPQEMNIVTMYCFNDIDYLDLLRTAISDRLTLRHTIGKELDIDVMCKSDAQMGEMMIQKRVEMITGRHVGRVNDFVIPPPFNYTPPDYIRFESDLLNDLLEEIREINFTIGGDGKVIPPEQLKKRKIEIGQTIYTMGIGGLHSNEKGRALPYDERYIIEDIDVSSHYPLIIAGLGLYPPMIGPVFIQIANDMIKERLYAKAKTIELDQRLKSSGPGNITVLQAERTTWWTKTEGLKIALNGSLFGKTGEPHSFLYCPSLSVATTLTGQLSLLMLAERFAMNGIGVESGNTDGLMVRFLRDQYQLFEQIVDKWQQDIGFVVERVRFKAVYSRDVNTYIGIKEEGGAKRKGWLDDPTNMRDILMKTRSMHVIGNAILKFVTDGTPLADTIRACDNPQKFVTVVRVEHGGNFRGQKLGRVVRWYWSTNGDVITYPDGKRVGKTEGAKPLMEMTSAMPNDIDWDRYITEAEKAAIEIGAMQPKLEPGLFTMMK